jgi:cytochrome c oxidase cbb3-type subunit 1
MEDYVRRFIRSSLVWLGVGVVLGVALVISPYHMLPYRPAHMHANLLGFISMMIFGVAYHVLPRFSGRGLRSPRSARIHLVLANGGLALMVAGFGARITWPHAGTAALALGGTASAIGAFLFIANIWITITPRPTALRKTP